MTLLAIPQSATIRVPEWSFTDRLRKAREAAGFTQQQLAEITTISLASIKNYEAGKRIPKPLYIRAWAEATGVPAVWLETGDEPEDITNLYTPRDSNPEPTDLGSYRFVLAA